jgi:hypothetical protein
MADAFPSLTATTSATTGTGALVLDIADRTDYLRTPKRAVTDGDLVDGDNVFFIVVDKSVVDGIAIFELNYGAYDDTANTLARAAGNVISGSNGPGALVSLPGSGLRDVLILDHIPQQSSQISNSNALRIDSTGKVGIGDIAPVGKLHVTTESGDCAIHVDCPNIQKGFIKFATPADALGAFLAWDHTNQLLELDSDGDIELHPQSGFVIIAVPDGIEMTVGGPRIITGSGSPESAITAPVGSLYMRDDGGAGTTLYVKESGTGNTGWIAK